MTYSTKQLIVFDLDGTLVVSKSSMDPTMTGLLAELLKQKNIAVISGGGFAQFQKTVVSILEPQCANLESLSLFPTCGAAYFRYTTGNGWRPIYQELLSTAEKQKIMIAFENMFREMHYEHPKIIYGAAPLEDRGSQMAFSPLGQAAPVAIKEDWRAKHESLRIRMRAWLSERLPEFEFSCGGLTTIDITRKGIDKAYGIKKMEEYLGIPKVEMLFIGDKLEPGGNDYPVKAIGVECIAVQGPEETKKIIERILGGSNGC